MAFCVNCAHPIALEERFCIGCDDPVSSTHPSPPPTVPTQRAVRLQLHRMLRSQEFVRAPQVTRLLQTLVEAAICGTTLSEYEIGIELGRPKDWSPLEDHLVRQTKLNLKKQMTTYARLTGYRDPVIIEVPKGRPHRAIYYYNPNAPRVAAGPLISFGLAFLSALEEYLDVTATGSLRCVVTGPAATWRHLDGNPYSNVLGNLIPLSERLQVHFNALKKEGKRAEIPELNAKRLAREIAQQCFANWETLPLLSNATVLALELHRRHPSSLAHQSPVVPDRRFDVV
jgi:hypothetical protein